MDSAIQKAKEKFYAMIKDNGSDPFCLVPHIEEVRKWADFVLKKHSEADKDIVMMSVFLHDIGHYPINKEEDHAITGERRAKPFLKAWKVDESKASEILHCIRSHRCKDVMPETIEAKIMACIDSASHMTDFMYISIAKEGRFEYALGKLERDFRDMSNFPEVKKDMKDIYLSWKKLLTAYEKLDFGAKK